MFRSEEAGILHDVSNLLYGSEKNSPWLFGLVKSTSFYFTAVRLMTETRDSHSLKCCAVLGWKNNLCLLLRLPKCDYYIIVQLHLTRSASSALTLQKHIACPNAWLSHLASTATAIKAVAELHRTSKNILHSLCFILLGDWMWATNILFLMDHLSFLNMLDDLTLIFFKWESLLWVQKIFPRWQSVCLWAPHHKTTLLICCVIRNGCAKFWAHSFSFLLRHWCLFKELPCPLSFSTSSYFFLNREIIVLQAAMGTQVCQAWMGWACPARWYGTCSSLSCMVCVCPAVAKPLPKAWIPSRREGMQNSRNETLHFDTQRRTPLGCAFFLLPLNKEGRPWEIAQGAVWLFSAVDPKTQLLFLWVPVAQFGSPCGTSWVLSCPTEQPEVLWLEVVGPLGIKRAFAASALHCGAQVEILWLGREVQALLADPEGSAWLAKRGHCFIFIFLTIENAAC